MIEVESKFWSPGNEKIEKALVRIGAKKVSDETMEDVYFAHPGRDFGKTDEALRLRKKSSGAELTYKGPRIRMESAKAREEINLNVDDPLMAQRIVERLGFREFCVVKKTRKSYYLEKLRIDVDSVEGLGDFVELELLTESPDQSQGLLESAMRELSLEKSEPRTYLEMIQDRKV